jgi:hypothetical protein
VNQTIRNACVFSTFAWSCLAAAGGCSSSEDGAPLGAGNAAGMATSGAAGMTGTFGGSSTAGTFGQSTSGSAGTPGAGGTFGAAGSFGAGGTFGQAGAGGAQAGGGAGGSSSAGSAAGGAPTSDFPANCPAPTGARSMNAMTRTCWGAKASDCAATNDNMNPPTQAIDATGQTTRFSTGAKMTASKLYTFEVDMGVAVMINGVTVGSEGTDYAPSLAVSVSTDGATFTPVACGTGLTLTDFSFAPVSARYVRVTQHGIADSWWSVHDFNVYRAGADDSCATAGTQMSTCTTPHTQ